MKAQGQMQHWQASEHANGTWRRNGEQAWQRLRIVVLSPLADAVSDEWPLERVTSEIRTAAAEC